MHEIYQYLNIIIKYTFGEEMSHFLPYVKLVTCGTGLRTYPLHPHVGHKAIVNVTHWELTGILSGLYSKQDVDSEGWLQDVA